MVVETDNSEISASRFLGRAMQPAPTPIMDQMREYIFGPTVGTALIKGSPGTGKTLLALELLRARGKGTYVSTTVLRQKLDSKNRDVEFVNIYPESRDAGQALDEDDYEPPDAQEVIGIVQEILAKKPRGSIVIDAWDAVAMHMEPTERMTAEFKLMSMVQASGSKLILLRESSADSTADYLADAIVELKCEHHNGSLRRELEVKKLRGQPIARTNFAFTLNGGMFRLCEPAKVRFPGGYTPGEFVHIKNNQVRYSTGSGDIDAFFGGGLPFGSNIAVELGKGISAFDLQPLLEVLMANFLANGGCVVGMPSPGIPPEVILQPLRQILPAAVVDSGVRLGFYKPFSDPCVFEANLNSVDATFENIWGKVRELKGTNRPCLLWISVEKLEQVHGVQGVMRNIVVSETRIRHHGDFLQLTIDETTEVKDKVAAVSDAHVKFEPWGNVLTAQPLKPAGPVHAVTYDYSKGYPEVGLVPIL